MRSTRRLILHPFFVSLYPPLALYVQNADQLPFGEAGGVLLLVLGLAAALWLLMHLLVKPTEKSALIVSLFLFLFFSFGDAMAFLTAVLSHQHLLGITGIAVAGVVVPLLWVSMFGAGLYFVAKTPSDLQLATSFLNVLSLCLILFLAARWLSDWTHADEARSYVDAWQKRSNPESQRSNVTPGSLPDIYYIIADGYARSDVLEEMYGLDNSEFLSNLTQKGFYVAERSRANYCQTTLSLASTLNFMYLDELPSRVGREATDRRPLAVMIEDNRLSQHLRQHGYSVLAYETGYPATEMKTADEYLSPPGTPNAFHVGLANTTPIPLVLELPFLDTLFDQHRARVLYVLDHLADATEIDSPTFVFAHLVAPHPPFVFGSDGEPVEPQAAFAHGRLVLADGSHFTGIAGKGAYVEGYRNQLPFITARLQSTIEDILSRSPDPPIIILQADHGPGSMLDWQSAENSNFVERMGILNAYYFPDQDYDALHPDITPVNTFRVVLNKYLGTDYEALEDRSYFSIWNRPYAFTEVPDEELPGSRELVE